MKKIYHIIILTLLSLTGYSQVYQSMPQYGYGPVKRMWVDSSLLIPTVCGVPTLKTYETKRAAVAYDSCNKRLYFYDPKLMTWDTIKGGGSIIDTTSLSSRINSKADSSINLQKVLKNGSIAYNYIDLYDTINGKTFEIYIAPRDGSGALIGMVDSFQNYIILETSGSAYTNPTITFINKWANQYLVQQDSSFGNLFLHYQNSGAVDTIATLGDIINIDTTNRWVNSVTKLNDSTIRVSKGNTLTDITLTPSSTVTSATRLSTSVYNNSGSTITKGSVVYINGRHSSGLPTVALAQANNENNSYKTFALIETDIATSNSGVAIQMGNIGNLNLPTSTYTDGDLLYLSPTIPGGFTLTKPLAPSHIVKLGSVTRAHPTLGSIQINIQNGWQLDELSDVKIATIPNDSTLLQFSRVDSLWHDVSPLTAIGNRYIKPSDTALMLTNYMRKADSSIYQTKYRSDSARTNIYTALNGKQSTLTNPVTGTGTSGNLVKFNGTSTVTNATADVDFLQNDITLVAMQAMGSSLKGFNIGLPNPTLINITYLIPSGVGVYEAIYIPQSTTISGIKFFQFAQGNFTANNFNGVALYSSSSGTLTRIGLSKNNGNIWKNAAASWNTQAFDSIAPGTLSAGIYYAMALYSTNNQVTQPGLGCGISATTTLANVGIVDFTNSHKFSGTAGSSLSAPPSSLNANTVTSIQQKLSLYLY